MATLDLLEDLVSIEEAARRVGRRPAVVRQFCLENGLAIKWGGGEKVKRYKVRLSEVKDALDANREKPTRAVKSHTITRPAMRLVQQMNPDVKC